MMATKSFYEDLTLDTPEAVANMGSSSRIRTAFPILCTTASLHPLTMVRGHPLRHPFSGCRWDR